MCSGGVCISKYSFLQLIGFEKNTLSGYLLIVSLSLPNQRYETIYMYKRALIDTRIITAKAPNLQKLKLGIACRWRSVMASCNPGYRSFLFLRSSCTIKWMIRLRSSANIDVGFLKPQKHLIIHKISFVSWWWYPISNLISSIKQSCPWYFPSFLWLYHLTAILLCLQYKFN